MSDLDSPELQAFVPRRKFDHGWAIRPIVLFLLTVATTTTSGCQTLPSIDGAMYSVAILTILAAHEFGHYFACRWHNVDCTLPHFLPAPLPLTGTLGAVIKIREPFPSRAALFDIGVAGPLAGFVTLLPFLMAGILFSDIEVMSADQGGMFYLGEPLLFKALARFIHGPLTEGTDIMIHPMGFGAWFGMLATALNLLPFGQLDGGHISYAVFGRRAKSLSVVTLAVVIGLSFFATSWIVMAVMLAAMSWLVGLGHPQPYDDFTPLSKGRLVVAFIALLIFAGCFTPTPITFAWE